MGIIASVWLAVAGLQAAGTPDADEAPLAAAEGSVLTIDVGPLASLSDAMTGTDLAALLADPAVGEFLETAGKRFLEKYRVFCGRLEDWVALGGRNSAHTFCTAGDLTLEALRGFDIERLRLMVFADDGSTPGAATLPSAILIVRMSSRQAEEAFEALRETARRLRDLHAPNVVLGAAAASHPSSRSEDVVSFVHPDSSSPLLEVCRTGRDLVVAIGMAGGVKAARQRLSTRVGEEIAHRQARIGKGRPFFSASLDVALLADFFSFLSEASRGTGQALAELLGTDGAERLTVTMTVTGRELQESWCLEPVSLPEADDGSQGVTLPAASRALIALETRSRPGRIARAFSTLLPDQFAGLVRRLAGACTGDVALGLWPPPARGDFPAMLFGARLADVEMAQRALDGLGSLGAGLIVETPSQGTVQMVTVKLRNFAGPFVPALAIKDGVLWLADNPRLLADRLGQIDTGVVGAEVMAGINHEPACGRIRFDSAGLFGLFYDDYLPLLRERLAVTEGEEEKPVFDLDRLPRLSSLIGHLGRGNGRLEPLDEQRALVVQRSSLGGAQNAFVTPLAVLVVGGAVGSTLDRMAMSLETQICAERLRLVQGALETYRLSFGGGQRYPRTLAELLERGLLRDVSALLVPSDANPDVIEYQDENGELRRLPVSYRFLSRPGLRLEDREVLLYEARPGAHGGRFVLFRDGETCHYGEGLFRHLVGGQ